MVEQVAVGWSLAQGAGLAAEVSTEAAVEQLAEDVADTAAAVPAEKAPV